MPYLVTGAGVAAVEATWESIRKCTRLYRWLYPTEGPEVELDIIVFWAVQFAI